MLLLATIRSMSAYLWRSEAEPTGVHAKLQSHPGSLGIHQIIAVGCGVISCRYLDSNKAQESVSDQFNGCENGLRFGQPPQTRLPLSSP